MKNETIAMTLAFKYGKYLNHSQWKKMSLRLLRTITKCSLPQTTVKKVGEIHFFFFFFITGSETKDKNKNEERKIKMRNFKMNF